MGGREGGSGGGSEGGREGGRVGGREGGRAGHLMGGTLMRELANIQYIHKRSHNAAFALETLVFQMKNSEQVEMITSVLRCVLMYCLSGG